MKTLLEISSYVANQKEEMLIDIKDRGQADTLEESLKLIEEVSLTDDQENLIFEQGMLCGMKILLQFIKYKESII